MKRHLPGSIILLVICYFQSFAQVPPVIDNFSVTQGYNHVNLFLQFTPNDTGTIKIQVQMTQGTGHDVYDSTYSVPAADSAGVTLYVGPIFPCAGFNVLVNLSNAAAQGAIYNPLTTTSTVCTTGISQLNENSFSIIASGYSVELHSGQIPDNGKIEIYDLSGRAIYSTGLYQPVQAISFKANAGMYLLRVTGSGHPLYATKFVID